MKETFIFFKAVDETEISLCLIFESTNMGVKGGGKSPFIQNYYTTKGKWSQCWGTENDLMYWTAIFFVVLVSNFNKDWIKLDLWAKRSAGQPRTREPTPTSYLLNFSLLAWKCQNPKQRELIQISLLSQVQRHVQCRTCKLYGNRRCKLITSDLLLYSLSSIVSHNSRGRE